VMLANQPPLLICIRLMLSRIAIPAPALVEYGKN